jgi:hypothetical protein
MYQNTLRSSLYCLFAMSLLACSGSESRSDPDGGNSIPNNNSGTNPTINNSNTVNQPVADDNNTPSPIGNAPVGEGLIGPLGGSGADGEYAQFNDSPFANLSFGDGYFYLEDFEDKVFDHPGASASDGDFVTDEFGPGFHDSVDADDGVFDGISLDGESWFYALSTEGIVWTFNANELGGNLPTHVGIVWTDGNRATTFEAYDAAGQSLGSIVEEHHDGSFSGETADDRFYGAVHYAGISAIKIKNDDRRNGIEVDHLQWGYMPTELR